MTWLYVFFLSFSFPLWAADDITGLPFSIVTTPSTLLSSAESNDHLEIFNRSHMSFEYAFQDGGFSAPCTYRSLDNHERDFKVICQKENSPFYREYTVHLIVRSYLRSSEPMMMYELLYWLTDHQVPVNQPGHYVGSTTRLYLKQAADFYALDLSQDVDNVALLQLRLRSR